jgi:hypothetical protein
MLVETKVGLDIVANVEMLNTSIEPIRTILLRHNKFVKKTTP